MAVEFLDEPGAAPSPAAPSGFDWIDSTASAAGVEFVDEPGAQASAREVTGRFLDPNYEPSLAEFKIYDAARRSRSVTDRLGDFASMAGDAATGLANLAVKAGAGLLSNPEENDPVLAVWEGVKRGTVRDFDMARRLLPDELLGGNKLNFDQFVAARIGEANQQKFRYTPLTPENQHTLIRRQDVAPEMLSKWRQEYDAEYLPENAYQRFLTKRKAVREEIAKASSAPAGVNPDVAEAASLVASPMAIIPFSRATAPLKTISRAVAAKTLAGAGKTFEWVGEKTLQAGTLPERAAGAAARAISGTEEAGAKATEVVASGVVGISAAPVKAAGKTIESIGEATQAVGRQAVTGPSRYGLLDRISKDAQAPQWMRRAASAARPIDPLLGATAIAAKGAAEGAGVGAVLGGLVEGEEGAASGAGGGLVLGAGGALAGRAIAGGRYRRGLEEMDLARWLASKSDAEVANIRALNLNHDQALALADVERMARGVRGPSDSGDVDFKYVTDAEFSKLFGVAKGAQVLSGDRPVLYINTGYKGPRSALHEVLHGLDALEGFGPVRQRLNRALFDQVLPDGTVASRGLYSKADVDSFTSQYRSRLNEAAKAEFDALSPEERQARIMSEVRAESFANLISGRTSSAFPGNFRSIRQRVSDSLLTADQDSMLGRMRRALESAGVRFDASGAPSELFVRNGRPITNTPSVDAALRDYLRAKDNFTRKLVAGDDDAPLFVVKPEDLARNPALREAFADSDMFARNPDGSIKTAVRGEDVARIEAATQQAIEAARAAASRAEAARQAAADAANAVAEASARSTEASRVASESGSREAKAQARAEKVRWNETRRRGEAQLKVARAEEKAAREQAQAARKQTERLSNAKLAAGVPVLLSEREIAAAQSKRVDQMMEALVRTPNMGERDVVTLKPNGAWEGRWFSESQLKAIEALPDDVLSPGMKAKLRELNAMATQDGAQVILDYNAALKGRRYSSGISPTTRAVVPLTFNISKAGNFYMVTLDTTHFFRKLSNWRRSQPKAFSEWGGDADAFLRDVFTYLDNHVNGRIGSVNLDADAAKAVAKKNVINDFFNVPKGKGNEDLNPVQISRPGDRDNLIRSRRFDRINRVTPGSGDRFPIRYELQKRNFMPAESFNQNQGGGQARVGASGGTIQTTASVAAGELARHLKAQSVYDVASKVAGPSNLAQIVAQEYVGALSDHLKGSAPDRARQVAQIAAATTPGEAGAVLVALMQGGHSGARDAAEHLALMRSLGASA